jgi:branched-chain amino acid transport system permease protein
MIVGPRLFYGGAILLGLSALAPTVLGEGGQRFLAECFLMLVMAQMWNLLAGYAGLVSFGHQVFVGLGAYALFITSNVLQISPYYALPAAPLVCACVAASIAVPFFRLREAYFAIAMWVFSEIVEALIAKTPWLGGTNGTPLTGSKLINFDRFETIIFWIAAGACCATIGGTYLIMSSRFGLGLMSVRDNDVAAASIGVDVQRNRFIAFVLSATGCGSAGAVTFLGSLFVSPAPAFDVNWVVEMMFIVIIGGIGTLEGPILGTVIYFGLREVVTDTFGLSAGWFLVCLGGVAVLTMLFAPRGLWPPIRDRLGFDFLSVRRRPPLPPVSPSDHAAQSSGASVVQEHLK